MMKKVLEYQQRLQLIQSGDRIVAGFSGGADSVCLLLLLKEWEQILDFSFCAVHVEHGIRGEESLADAAFAKEFCETWQIPFLLYSVDVPKLAEREHLSLEEAARILRYDCFEQAKQQFGANKVAVAHHSDDNGETMLFHLVRGSGLRGLIGMQPERDGIIRPLLCVCRQEIERFLEEKGVSYCTDSTNSQVQYARNRIRNNIMSELTMLNARATEHMAALSEQLSEVYEYLARTAWETGQQALCRQETQTGEWELSKKLICQMEPVLQKEFLYQILTRAAESRKDIGAVHVESLRQLFCAEVGKQIHLPYQLTAKSGYETVRICRQWNGGQRNDTQQKDGLQNDTQRDSGFQSGGQQIDRSQGPMGCAAGSNGKIVPIELTTADLAASGSAAVRALENGMKIRMQVLAFDGEMEKIPEKTYTKWFDYDRMKDNLSFRHRQPGDYIQVTFLGGRKKLKEYLINEKIPREQREELVLLTEGSEVIWVIGHRISEGYKITAETKRILEVCVERE